MVFSLARWQEQYYNYDNSNKTNSLFLTAPYPKNMEVSVMGIQYTSGRHGNNVCSGYNHFRTSPLLYHGEKG